MTREDPIIFDQFSRYRASARVLRLAGCVGDTILDVGSGQGRLLERFLPDRRITYIDPLLDVASDNVIPTPFEQADLADRRFDFVIAVDTLEHVPQQARADFLARMSNAASKGVVVAGPCRDVGQALQTDAWLNDVYLEKSGRNYPWLDEHLRYGLPDSKEIVKTLEARGWHVGVYPNGYAPWLRELLPLVLCLLDNDGSRALVDEVSVFFNEQLAEFDDREPCYRQIVAGVHDPTLLPAGPKVSPEMEDEADARWDTLRRKLVARTALLIEQSAERAATSSAALARLELADGHDVESERAAPVGLENQLHEEQASRVTLQNQLRVEQAARLSLQGQLQAEQAARLSLQGQLQAEQAVRLSLENQLGAKERDLLAMQTQYHAVVAGFQGLQQSLAWRLAKPIRGAVWLLGGVRRRLVGWLKRAARFVYRRLPFSDDLRWRLTALLCETFRPLLRHTSAWTAYQRRRSQRAGPPPSAEPAAVTPPLSAESTVSAPPPQADREDIVVWGIIDWHFRFQRPQHLAQALAEKGHRVFYLSPLFIDAPTPGFGAERLSQTSTLYNIRLHVDGSPLIYHGEPDEQRRRQLRESVASLLRWAQVGPCISLVDHPGWTSLAAALPNSRVCYDCMDNHHGFEESGDLRALEERLLAIADAVIVSSDWLEQRCRGGGAPPVLVRNGCEPRHFSVPSPELFQDPQGRRIIGYFGAIAEWFDLELVRAVAGRFRDCLVLLVGADTAGAGDALRGCSNVQVVGEVPYAKLPSYAQAMDVCLIPFAINELTAATNPVKLYEYLALGRPVVTTDLPELRQPEIDQLIYRATDAELFLEGVARALDEVPDAQIRARREAFAVSQSWENRACEVELALARPERMSASIVIVTWNNLALTRRCIESILADSLQPGCEVIVVDNASTDETAAYLSRLAASDERIRVILNEQNLGFAAANNQGLELARGDYLVLLNNDTVVTEGWLRTLVNHLRRDPSIGLLGPITNNIGNEARVEVDYGDDLLAMPHEAYRLTRTGFGRLSELEALAFFCVAFRREVYQTVGPLDENFGLGFFEDDDYGRRVRAAGWRTVCTEDVFIHHELSASFAKVPDETRKALFEENRAYFESKWGKWSPHRYRPAETREQPP